MTRLNVLLLLVLLVSCGYLVTVAHESRQLFADLDKTQSEARLLDSDFERLKSEKQSQATPLRVEKTARESKSEVDRRAPFAPEQAHRLRAVARIKPSEAEVRANPRSRSAVMRVAERTDAPDVAPNVTSNAATKHATACRGAPARATRRRA